MKKCDDPKLTIVISKGQNHEMSVDCDLSYIDNLGDCAEEHGEEEKEFVDRSIVLLRNIVDDVVRSWKNKGGDVAAYEGNMLANTNLRLRKRKTLNYDETRMLTSSQLSIRPTSSQNERGRKKKEHRSLPSQKANWTWEPQIVLDVQEDGDSWELRHPISPEIRHGNSGGSHAVTTDNSDSQTSKQLADVHGSGSGPSALVGLDEIMIAESRDVVTTHDESCWIRPSTCMSDTLQAGHNLLKEVDKQIEQVERACGLPVEATLRKDQGVNTEDVADETDNSGGLIDSAIALVDDSSEACLQKLQKIVELNSAEEPIAGSPLQHKSTSTTCDSALEEYIIRIKQIRSGTSVPGDSRANRLCASPSQSVHSPTTSQAVSQALDAVQFDEMPIDIELDAASIAEQLA